MPYNVGTPVRSLVWEDPMYLGVAGSVCHNFQAHEPQSPRSATEEASVMRGQHATASSGPHSPQLEKAHSQPINKYIIKDLKKYSAWNRVSTE